MNFEEKARDGFERMMMTKITVIPPDWNPILIRLIYDQGFLDGGDVVMNELSPHIDKLAKLTNN